jgi:glycosyltransferase involved in cell wall biosynthesis
VRTDARPSGAVLIPAHNEALTIGRTLTALLDGPARAGDDTVLDVVIVSNGSVDGTAEVARGVAAMHSTPVSVLELPDASKTAALRAAEAVAGFPRLYLDADVVCSRATALALLDAVSVAGVDLAVPTRDLDLAHASRLAALYYRTWASLPWVRQQLAGRGALALSQAGRERIGALPDLVADDRFLTTRVPAASSRIVPERVVIRPPGSLRSAIRVRSRIYHGNSSELVPSHDAARGTRLTEVLRLAARPVRWPGLVVFVVVSAAAKVLAASSASNHQTWARDGSRGGSEHAGGDGATR